MIKDDSDLYLALPCIKVEIPWCLRRKGGQRIFLLAQDRQSRLAVETTKPSADPGAAVPWPSSLLCG
jgi:hypothetical protein